MKIRLLGQSNHTGIGTHFSEFYQALKVQCDLEIETVDVFDERSCQDAVISSTADDVNICFTASDLRALQGFKIQWIPFETTRLPGVLLAPLVHSDMIWTMTHWGKQILIDNGLPRSKIHVVPQGIDTQTWIGNKPDPLSPVREFLLTGKCEQRKCILETLQAWSMCLKNDPSARLTIKTHAGLSGDQGYDDIIQCVKRLGIENYRIIWGVMSDADMLDLYQQSHVMVLPSRAEGWGRPLMEAAAMGMPIITTRYSAHGEWLQDIEDGVIWVDHDLVDLDDEDYRRAYGHQPYWGQWAQPRIDSLCHALTRMQQDYAVFSQKAWSNREWIRQNYDWSVITELAMRTVDQNIVL